MFAHDPILWLGGMNFELVGVDMLDTSSFYLYALFTYLPFPFIFLHFFNILGGSATTAAASNHPYTYTYTPFRAT